MTREKGGGMSGERRVGIVGGSIGGCATAACLSRNGWEVELFERSEEGLVDRGAGIATFGALLDALTDLDLIGADLPRCDLGPMRWVGRDTRSTSGRVLGSDPAGPGMSTLRWGDLYTHLRRRVPREVYDLGSTVVEVESSDDHPGVHLADGSRRHYDVVVCADGYQSLGRSTLFPEAALRYRGYVLWRGLVPRGSASGTATLEVGGVRCGYSGGHGVFYLVPSATGEFDSDARAVNWGLYLQVPEAELEATLVDRFGRTSNSSVAAGMLAEDREAALKARARELLPEEFAQIVDESRDTFIQAIFTVTVPAYRRGRVCLIGDAGTLYPPFSGSGVLKALTNAIDLAARLEAAHDVDDALADWNRVQLRNAATFEAAAETFERALIFDMPDLAAFNEQSFAAWHAAVFADVPPPRRAVRTSEPLSMDRSSEP
jgi:2-polyprenyl-6-methoxyphenol hydroxylase-like FAD-dependent oxidoreductase